jgi:phage terminase large subunit-like protein
MSLSRGRSVGSLESSETVKVGAVFKGDMIVPKWFNWQGRKYEVKEVNYNWLDKQGREKVHCFSVTDGTNNYELAFYSEKTVWKLTKVYSN